MIHHPLTWLWLLQPRWTVWVLTQVWTTVTRPPVIGHEVKYSSLIGQLFHESQLTSPDLALRHVEEEAELAVLAPGVSAAPPGHRLSDVGVRMRSPRGRPNGQGPIMCAQGRAVRRVAAAVEAGPGGGAKPGRVDHQEVTRGTGEHQLRGVTP